MGLDFRPSASQPSAEVSHSDNHGTCRVTNAGGVSGWIVLAGPLTVVVSMESLTLSNRILHPQSRNRPSLQPLPLLLPVRVVPIRPWLRRRMLELEQLRSVSFRHCPKRVRCVARPIVDKFAGLRAALVCVVAAEGFNRCQNLRRCTKGQ